MMHPVIVGMVVIPLALMVNAIRRGDAEMRRHVQMNLEDAWEQTLEAETSDETRANRAARETFSTPVLTRDS